jgi:hypothetical protein
MGFYFIRCIIVWTCWFIFADKSRWRELFPVGIFAGFLDGFADIFSYHYPLWKYNGMENSVIPDLFDNLGLYIVVAYLFIQGLPKHKTMSRMLVHWFFWSFIVINIEWFHVYTGHMIYGTSWNIAYSYLVDWIIFGLLYQFHKVFQLEKLSK